MRSIFTLSCFLLVIFGANGQIAVTNATFPKVGDVLRYLVLDEAPDVNVGTPGENKSWNFSTLTGGQPQTESYLDKSTGTKEAEFPGANMLIRFSGVQNEFYANANNLRIELVGFAGENPFFPGELIIQYVKRPQLRRHPMYYETTSRSEGEWRIQVSSNVLPDTLLNQLQLRPDSIRVAFNSIANDTIDAWGKVTLAGKTYDVLREKSVNISETKIFFKLPFIGWIDLSVILGGGGLPAGIDGFLGADTTTTYNFYTNTLKEILVSVDTDNMGNILGITYANTNTVSAKDEWVATGFKAYPNPATDRISIEINDGIKEDFSLSMVDISGKTVLRRDYPPSESVSLDVQHLMRGLYVVRLEDRQGKVLHSSRVTLQ